MDWFLIFPEYFQDVSVYCIVNDILFCEHTLNFSALLSQFSAQYHRWFRMVLIQGMMTWHLFTCPACENYSQTFYISCSKSSFLVQNS